VRDVLERTSGSPCRRALDLLPDLTDGVLPGVDRQLVQGHLEHCAGCRAVAVAMSRLGDDLAALADLDPGPEFTAAVLARTTARTEAAQERRRKAAAGRGPAGLMDRAGRWWQERILAPRFAMQVAYAATFVIVLLVGTPWSPFKGAPARMLEAVQASPGGMPVLGTALTWTAQRAEIAAGDALDGARDGLAGSWRDLRADWRARTSRTADERRLCGAGLADALDELLAGRPADAGARTLDAYRSGRAAWTAWWADADGTTEDTETDGP
jgi:hypothetical protein